MQNEIFRIALDDEGRSQINQLFRKIRVIFIGSFVWSGINVLSILARLTLLSLAFSYGKNISQLVIFYSIWVLTVIILPLQAYYYYAFSKRIKQSIEEQNSEKFNAGFRLLNINATLVLLSLVVSFFNSIYNVLLPFLNSAKF
jgi:hypothetical protein